MDIAIIILLVIILALQIYSLTRKSAADNSRVNIKDSEDRILKSLNDSEARLTKGLESVMQSQNRSFGEIKVAINESNRILALACAEEIVLVVIVLVPITGDIRHTDTKALHRRRADRKHRNTLRFQRRADLFKTFLRAGDVHLVADDDLRQRRKRVGELT